MAKSPILMICLAAWATLPVAAAAQTDRIVPSHEVVITGYGTVGYALDTQGENRNAFTSSISPIFLFQFQDRVLFEAEFEFELQEGVTETGLEYAQLDFIASDNLVLVGGKFLVPFGVFGERLHPTWINKFTTSPPIYGHHVSSFGADPLMPILSDVGVMARGAFNPGRFQIGLSAYVTQGPIAEGADEIPELEFPASSGDNNTNKMTGGRLDVGLPPWVQLSFSYLNGDYDDIGVLDLSAWNIAGELRVQKLELRGELLQTRQEIETFTGFPTFLRTGFYAQASYRIGRWEPLFRLTQVFDDELDGVEDPDTAVRQLGFGLDYWFTPSISLMSAYEINQEDGLEVDNNRLITHIAFGF